MPDDLPNDPRLEYLDVAGLHLKETMRDESAGFVLYSTKEFPFELSITFDWGTDHSFVHGRITFVANSVWEKALLVNAPESHLRDLTRLGTPKVSAPSQEEALKTIQEGMGKFLLQAARGLSFWNSFGQLASKKEGG